MQLHIAPLFLAFLGPSWFCLTLLFTITFFYSSAPIYNVVLQSLFIRFYNTTLIWTMKWSWLLDTWRILINPVRSWSPWSWRILNLLIFRNKSSLNRNWILFIVRLKRKLLHLDLLLLLRVIVFSNSIGFSWALISFWKTRQNPNTTKHVY